MDIDKINAAELYELFMGFNEEPGNNDYNEFYRYCLRNIEFPTNLKDKKFNILSIGTGYGRADFPFIRAFIEKCKPNSTIFNIYCLDPSLHFAQKLYKNLDTGFDGKFDFFSSSRKKVNIDKDYNHFVIEGVSFNKKSTIKIIFLKADLAEFLESHRCLKLHCIISFLSIQLIRKVKIVFPELLTRLQKYGIILLGECGEHAEWIADRPPPIFDGDKKYRIWYQLWSDWHRILEKKGIMRNLRLLPPHDLQLVFDFFNNTESFKKIRTRKNASAFIWEKSLEPEVFSRVIKAIENDEFRNVVSSLFLEEHAQGREIINELINFPLKNKYNFLYGTWQEFVNKKFQLNFKNGLKLTIYSKTRDSSFEKFKKEFQKTILRNAYGTLRKKGLFEYPMPATSENDVKTVFSSISMGLKQHIELEKGAFIVATSVMENSDLIASLSGSLIPASRESIESGDSADFFRGFDLLANIPTGKKKKLFPRVWLLLYELSLKLAEKPSQNAPELQKAFNLTSNFNLIIDMDGNSEEIIKIDKSFVSLVLDKHRFQTLRQEVWNIIGGHLILRNKFKQLIDDYDDNSEVIKQLESFWGKFVKKLFYSESGVHGFHESFTPLSYFKPEADRFVTERLFSVSGFDEIKLKIRNLFNLWRKESRIISQLHQLKKDAELDINPNRIWDILCQYYIFGIFISEKNLRYIFHVSLPYRKGGLIWGATNLYLHKDEASFFIDYNAPRKPVGLKQIFHNFILPFDKLILQGVHSEKIKEESEREGKKIGQSDLAYTFGHEVKSLNIFLNTDYWTKRLNFFFDLSDEPIRLENAGDLEKMGKIFLYEPQEKYRELLTLFGIFPFGDLVSNIGRMNNFWGSITSVVDIPFQYKQPKNSPEFIKECWKYSIKNFIISLFSKKNVTSLKKLIFYYELKKALEKNLEDKVSVEGDLINIQWEKQTVYDQSDDDTGEYPYAEKPSHVNLFSKILMAVFNNCLVHGEMFDTVNILITKCHKRNSFYISIKNKKGTGNEKNLPDSILKQLCESFTFSKDFYNQPELQIEIDEIIRTGKVRLNRFIYLTRDRNEEDIKTPHVIDYCLRNINHEHYDKKADYKSTEIPEGEEIYYEVIIRIESLVEV